jgi:hypothetical protein
MHENMTIDRSLVTGIDLYDAHISTEILYGRSVKVSPCLNNPLSGYECVLATYDKNNTVCLKCGHRDMGPLKLDNLQILQMLDKKQIVFGVCGPCFTQSKPKKTAMKYPCTFEGCEHGMTQKPNYYCRYHYGIIRNRKRSWNATYGPNSDPPIEYLLAPIKTKGKKITAHLEKK